MGTYTHITMNQRQDVVYRHSYPHLILVGANLRFGIAKIVDHHYGCHDNNTSDGASNEDDDSPQDRPPKWPSGTLSIAPLPEPIEHNPAHDPDPDERPCAVRYDDCDQRRHQGSDNQSNQELFSHSISCFHKGTLSQPCMVHA